MHPKKRKKMLNKIEDSLNGGYGGLYSEVVVEDTYKLKQLNFIPTVIFDVGANIGIFSRYARSLFPEALIVSIEPNPSNIEVFKQFTNDSNLILIEKAIGNGKVWHGLTARNGSGETYLSAGVGFVESEMNEIETLEDSGIETIKLSEIINQYVKEGYNFIVKLDIEGNEHVLFFDEIELSALKKADYLCAEIHKYSLTARDWQEVQDKTDEVLQSFSTTHNIEIDGVHFFAAKIQNS